jgi:hypothetical protein
MNPIHHIHLGEGLYGKLKRKGIKWKYISKSIGTEYNGKIGGTNQ